MSVVPLPVPTHPRAGDTRPPARRKAAGGDVVRLHPWTPAERKAALERLCAIVDADPRGKALATSLRRAIERYE